MKKSPFLSKTNYLVGLQCPKYLWTRFHEPEKIPEPDTAIQYRFNQGHLIGQLAKELFPSGTDLPTEDFVENIKQTRLLLEQGAPVFEGGVQSGSIYSRLDILNPAGSGKWDIIEVKSTSSVKDEHYEDVAFQRFCCEKSGLTVNRCHLMHLNSNYVRNGEIDPGQLFTIEDITAGVDEVSEGIEDRSNELLALLASGHCPDIPVGNHCSSPHDCPLYETCWSSMPLNNIFRLYGRKKKIDELLERGIISIADVPDEYLANEKQRIQKKCELNCKPHLDRKEVASFLNTLEYPHHFLDFETFGTGVPLFDGVRPYQQVPFQFSLHIQKSRESKLKHHYFLAQDNNDPRPELVSALKKVIGNEGSIIVYNRAFEDRVLRDLGSTFPEYSDWLDSLHERIIDLLSPFRNFDYYHPAQKGSASLKKVLPALTGKSYDDLDIPGGQEAGIQFLAAMRGDTTDGERKGIREALLEYCGLDTEGMSMVVQKLNELVSG